jgi:hypothetical protein
VVLAHWRLHGLYPWPLGWLTPAPRVRESIYLAPAKSMKDGRLQHTYPAHSAPCQTISSLPTLKVFPVRVSPELELRTCWTYIHSAFFEAGKKKEKATRHRSAGYQELESASVCKERYPLTADVFYHDFYSSIPQKRLTHHASQELSPDSTSHNVPARHVGRLYTLLQTQIQTQSGPFRTLDATLPVDSRLSQKYLRTSSTPTCFCFCLHCLQ